MTTATDTRELQESETERVTRWRLEQLVGAGYDEGAAMMIACKRQIDLHYAADLLRRGCPAETAARILL